MTNRKQKLVDLVVDRYVNLELFYRKQQPAENGCIEWTGVKNNVGYPFIGFRTVDPETGAPAKGTGGMMTAHRLAWMITHRQLPTLPNINHTCHNKLCVNPDHLTEGTQRDKLVDMIRDGVKNGRPLGSTGYNYNHEQTGRVYKYSRDEIQWLRTATLDEICRKYSASRQRAAAMRFGFRAGYSWLPAPVDKYESDPRGRRSRKEKK